MSGFEIAGLVLGAFPILCEAATGLRGVFKDFRSWRRFETTFENFILGLEREHISFSQTLDLLLDPIDNLSQNDRQALRDDPSSPLWFDSRIQKELEQRVQPKYHDWFMRQLRGMNDALNELHVMLPFDKDEVHHLDSSSLESEMFRIRTSFSHKKDRVLSEISTRNASLYEFLEREQSSRFSRTSVQSPSKGDDGFVASLLEFQLNAKSVFKGFQQHWACSCSAVSHSCRISTRDSHLKVLLEDGSRITHIKIDMEKTLKTPETETFQLVPGSTKHEDITALRHHVSTQNRLFNLKKKVPRSILKMTASTLSALSNPAGVGTRMTQDSVEKKPGKLTTRSRTEAEVLAIRSLKVQFDSAPVSSTQVVSPATATTHMQAIQAHEKAIEDICSVFQQQEPYLGFLEIQDARLLLHHDADAGAPPPKVETLEEFMKTTPRRDARLKLGLSITSNVLKLGPSWIPESWHKSSLVLLRTSELLPSPYISHHSIHTFLRTTPTSEASRARESLLTIGILLLELLFHDTIENQPFRAKYLNGQGKPNSMTDLCTALEWQKEVEAEFGDRLADVIMRCVRCDFGPTPDLSSSAFVRAVWLTVAHPLEEFLKVYSNVA